MRLFPIFFCLLLLFTPTLAKELSSEEIIALVEQAIQQSNDKVVHSEQFVSVAQDNYCSRTIEKTYSYTGVESISGGQAYYSEPTGTSSFGPGSRIAYYIVPNDLSLPVAVKIDNLRHSSYSSYGWFVVSYKILDSNGACTVSKSTGSVNFAGVINSSSGPIGTWVAAATKNSFYLYATYYNNISVARGEVLNFTVSSFWINTDYCWVSSSVDPWGSEASNSPLSASAVFKNFYLLRHIYSSSFYYNNLTALGRLNGYTATVVYTMVPSYLNFTVEYNKNIPLLKLSGYSIPGQLTLSFDRMYNITLQNTTLEYLVPPIYKQIIVQKLDGSRVFETFKLSELLPCYKVNVTTTLTFKNAATGENISGVNLLLTGGYNFNGIVNNNFSFVALSGDVVDYVAKKEGYKIATGSIQITDDRVVEILLEPETYGDAQSNYVTEVKPTKAKINEPIIVKIKNTAKAWWNPFDPEWIEGAEIYVDGNPTGITTKKPVDDSWWIFSWLKNWLLPGEPFAVISIDTPGDHYVFGKVGEKFSKAAIVTITNETYTKGGAPSGEFPKTDPDPNNLCYYSLLYTPQALKTGGTVTFKTVKVCGETTTAVNGLIYVDNSFIGEARPELTYKFTSPGVYRVKANIGGQWTGEGIITVFAERDEFSRDSGSISLTVRVYAVDTGLPLAGILVQRVEGSTVVEQRWTNSSGVAVLKPVSNKNYTIIVSDTSNRYISQMKTGSWTGNATIEFYLKPAKEDAGDVIKITHIEVRIDGIPEDGVKLPPGKHRITVVDQDGKELSDVEIYLNGQKIGKTGGWLWGWFGAGLEYSFDIGNYEIVAIAPSGLSDSLYVIITNNVSSYMLIAYPGKKGWLGTEFSSSAMINFVQAIRGVPVKFEVREVTPNKPMSEWKAVENAVIYVDGNEVGVTKPIGGVLGFGATPAYEHTFTEPGNYTVYAKYGDATTQTLSVTVSEETKSSDGIGGIIGEFFGGLADSIPLIGIKPVDTILWALLIIVGGLLVVSIVIRVII